MKYLKLKKVSLVVVNDTNLLFVKFYSSDFIVSQKNIVKSILNYILEKRIENLYLFLLLPNDFNNFQSLEDLSNKLKFSLKYFNLSSNEIIII